MYDDISTPLNFSIADIREPEKRNSSYSKTIKIPGTANNNVMFGNIFDINVSASSYNPNRKIPCILLIDDEQVMNGYLQLTNIIRVDKKIEYEVVILGNVGNPFNDMGNLELTDLDFSSGDHLYNYATQVASWNNTWQNLYCYPYIDYGFDPDLSKVDVEHLLPAIFVKAYIIKILEQIGYRYESNFIDSTFFENLIIPATGGRLIYSDAQISPRLFSADIGATQSGASNTLFDIIFDTETIDPSFQYDPVTGEWTVLNTGYYNLNVTATGSSTVSGTNYFGFLRKPSGGAYAGIGGNGFGLQSDPNINTSVSNVQLNAGDKVKFVHSVTSSGGSIGTVTVLTGTFKNAVVNSGLIEGETVPLNNAIPIKIKQKDFFLNIIKLFNLYVDIDKNDDRKLIIEPRDVFYSSGTNIDWSYKLDLSRDVEYNPMGALDFKELIYTYTEDSDYYNTKYKNDYQEVYGRRRVVTENEFLQKTSTNQVIFAATPLVGDLTNDRVIPRIWTEESINVKAKAFKMRILYRGGIKTTSSTYDYTGRFSGSHLLTQYLYAGHLDDVANPTLDLCFGVPQEVYYDLVIYTTNNLYNAYHRSYVEEIIDIDSRIVTAWFYLTKTDIGKLDFRNQFFFDNQYFRLNKIYDYDPVKHDVTKCEFIKIKVQAPFSASQTSLNGGYNLNYEDGYPTRGE